MGNTPTVHLTFVVENNNRRAVIFVKVQGLWYNNNVRRWQMLEFLDAILVFIFKTLPFIIMIGASVVFSVAALAELVSNESSLFKKTEGIGLALTIIACTCWFFVWLDTPVRTHRPEMGEFSDYSFLPAVFSLFVVLVVLTAARAIRAFGIPWIVIGFIYIGIALFGL